MAGGQPRCLSCFLPCCGFLLFGVSIRDVEASSCQRIIHKQVGDTVELPSCLPSEGVIAVQWRYGSENVADMDQGGTLVHHPQFTGRAELNPTNFSLTVKNLILQDSGVFSFVSETNNSQRETIPITLHVHDRVTTPVLTENTTLLYQNGSCTVWLRCTSASGSSVSYNWTVREQTFSGSSTLQYPIRPHDGDVQFTCTVWNVVTGRSAYVTVKCSNTSHQVNSASDSSSLSLAVVRLTVGILLVLLLVLSLLYFTKLRDACMHRLKPSSPANQDETQQQVYSSLLHGDDCVYASACAENLDPPVLDLHLN